MRKLFTIYFLHDKCYFFVLESHSSYANEKIIKISDDLELKQLSENVFIHVSYGDFENYKHVPANGFDFYQQGQSLYY